MPYLVTILNHYDVVVVVLVGLYCIDDGMFGN